MKLTKLLVFVLVLPFLYGFTNIAHRGDNELGKYSEHSFAAYDRAAIEGANYLELDLQQTKDGILVVSHDDNLSRVFGIDKSIPMSKYVDLLGYYNQDGEELHGLKQVFQRYKADPSIKFMIETKVDDGANMEKPLIALIKKYHLKNRILFESFSLASLQKLAKLGPTIPRTQLGGDYHNIGNNQYYANSFYSRSAAKYLHSHYKKYLLWGVNSSSAMESYLKNPYVDGLLTDYPNRLARILPHNSLEVNSNQGYLPKKIHGRRYIKSPSKCSVMVFDGYGNQSQYTGMMLKPNTKITFNKIALEKGTLWYCIGSNLWINGKFTSYSKHSKSPAPKTKVGLLSTKKITTIYRDAKCKIATNRNLRSNSQWHYFAFYKNRNHSAYNLGGNQWVKAQDVKIKKGR